MKFYKKLLFSFLCLIVAGLFITSCQKLDRPVLKELILDPPPPPLQIMDTKIYFPFDGNARDTGENKAVTTGNNISYTAGVTYDLGVTGGEAVQIGNDGYVLIQNVNDNIKSPGSLTLAFWMKGAPGPVQGGAQGVFAIANSTQFWGNLEIFLENYEDPDDANAVFMKIHMFNDNVAGGGEEWTANDDVKLKNVLGKWTHIALTYDAATSSLSLYKDGQPTAVNNKILGGGNYGDLKFADVSGMVVGNFAFQTTPSLTTHGPEGWAKSFNGALDQFRIYTKALSAAEVNNLYTNKL